MKLGNKVMIRKVNHAASPQSKNLFLFLQSLAT